ncbi:MAG: transglycosylase SLT domain-containing protein [Nitrospirae bacterium]|nr:transglycosylase SLT domain-containing protein [Nitrospirota bacterium]
MSPARIVSILILVPTLWLFAGPKAFASDTADPAPPDENTRSLADYDPIRDHLHHRLCLFYEKETELRRGAECHEALYRSYPDSPLRAEALFRAGQIYHEIGELQHAGDLFNAFLHEFPDNRRVPEVYAGLGRIAYEEGRYRDAGDLFRKIRVGYPADAADEIAKEYFDEVRKKVPDYPGLTLGERLERARGLYDHEKYREAITIYKDLLETKKLRGKDRGEMMFYIARSQDRLREWTAAAMAYQNYLKRYPDGQHAGEALFRSGRIALRLDKEENYLKAHRRYLKKYPSGKYRHEIRYGLALFYIENGNIERATAALDRIREGDPRGEWGAKALWEKGWLAYRLGKYAAAVKHWDRLARLSDPSFRVMALYWQGRGLERMGDPGAADRFRDVCDQYPRSYYCFAAGVDVPVHASLTASDAESWPDLPSEITAHPRYPRIETLARVGWLPEAAQEARTLRTEFGEDPPRLLALAYLLLQIGDTPHTLDILQTHFSSEIASGGMETDLPFQRIAFPLDYAGRIAFYAEPLGVDPALASALIREESWFNPKAVSPAGALGLMQVMPATAKRILAVVPDPPSSSGTVSSLLVDPEWNIRLGVRFLADMLARFNGEIVFAVAAYNAGPGAVDRWIRTIPADTPDEFVESIPYPETRRYVKRVLRSYAEYRRAFQLGS